MSYYWCNRQEILQKAKGRYSKEKAVEYYQQNKEVIKQKSTNRYKNMSEEEKNKIKEYQKKIPGINSIYKKKLIYLYIIQ